jgi:hypothetical protein
VNGDVEIEGVDEGAGRVVREDGDVLAAPPTESKITNPTLVSSAAGGPDPTGSGAEAVMLAPTREAAAEHPDVALAVAQADHPVALDPIDGSTATELLRGIPGAIERIKRGSEQAHRGEVTLVDEL